MFWLATPRFDDEERRRKARLVLSIIRFVLVAVGLTSALSLLEPKNDVRVTVGVYAPVLLITFGAAYAIQRGRIVLAAWVMALLYWSAVALSVALLGGLQWQNGTAFVVAVMMAGAVIGTRAAIAFSVLSVAVAGAATYGHLHDALPAPLAPMTPINAFTSLTVTLALVGLMLHLSLRSLQDALDRARQHARERDEAREKLLRTQKMEVVGRLSSGIAHDFNNLLSVIVGTTDLLQLSELSSEDEELVEQLSQAAERAGLMTAQLLSFGRAHHDVAAEPVDLAELLPAFAPLISRLVSDTIVLDLAVDPGPQPISATRVGVEQILLNLAINARDAMPDGGRMTIRCHGTDDAVQLDVEDEGEGMTEQVRARLFEPFFTTKDKGTGLGLATVQDLVVRFGATLDVRSQPNEGSTFSIVFPRLGAGAAPPPSSSGELPAVQPLRILLVDDQASVQKTLAALLEALGHHVTVTSDGRAALEVFDATRFDLVITDVAMPGMTGFELAEALAARPTPPPILFVSGNARPEDCPPYPARAELIGKPITRAELARAVSTCLGREG